MSDYIDEGRKRFIKKLTAELARAQAELGDVEARYELASCLPSLDRGYEDHLILVKMQVTSTAPHLAGQIELLEARVAALQAALGVMTAEA